VHLVERISLSLMSTDEALGLRSIPVGSDIIGYPLHSPRDPTKQFSLCLFIAKMLLRIR